MSNQIVISSGAKVRNLDGVLTGTSGIVNSVPLGAANGVATLDSGGKVPVSQLPSSVVTYLGTWNAATNTPTLVNGTGDAGDMYICNVAGTVNFGAGPVTFAVGDWVLYGSGTWQKSNGQNGTVTSVGVSRDGDALSITGSPITTAGTINIGFTGSNAQYINGEGDLVTFPSLSGFVTDVTGTAPIVSSGGTTPAISIPAASSTVDGYLDNADWTTFNNKQNAITLTTTGTSGVSTLIGSTLNIPNYSTDLSGYVPYTGATANVNLGTFDLTADVITGATGSFASNGGSNTFAINHSSGSGIALNITKGGNGEGLYINKTSGSGNAATIIGTLNATTLVKSGGTSSQFLKADGSVDASAYITLASLSAGAGISYNNTTGVIASTITQYTDALARAAISLTTTGTSGAATYNNTTGVLNIPNYAPDLSGYVTLGTAQTISGAKTFTSNIQLGAIGTGTSTATPLTINLGDTFSDTAGANLKLRLWASSSGVVYGFGVSSDQMDFNIPVGAQYKFWTGNAIFTNNVTAASLIKSGGTASQFLKADGSVDSNSYALASALGDYLPLTAGSTKPLTGDLYINRNAGGIFLTRDAITDYNGIIYKTGTDFKWYAGMREVAGAGNDYFIFNSATNVNALRINTTSSIVSVANSFGVGTTSPETFGSYNTIEVSAASGGVIFAKSTTGSVTTQLVADNGTSSGYVGTRTNHPFTIRTNNVDRFEMSSTGNGVFINGLQSKTFDVISGTIDSFSFGVNANSTFAFGSTNGRRLAIFQDGTQADNGLQFGFDATAKTGIIAGSATSAGTGIDFYTYNGSTWANRMRLTKDGLVGIGLGTNNPTTILQISQAADTRVNIISSNNLSSGLYLQTFNGATQTGGATIRITNTGSLEFYNGGASDALGLMINSSLNVGIGTNTPLFKLHVNKAGGNGIFVSNTTNNTGAYIYAGTNIEFQGVNSNNTASLPICMQPYGSTVLIGTSTAITGGGALQVNGNVNINGVFQINGVTIGGGGGSGVTGSGTTSYVPKWTGSTSLGNSIMYDSGTRIGFGTTNPRVKVEILNSPSSDPVLGTASGNLMLSDNNLWGMLFGLNGTTGHGWIQQMRIDSAVSYPLMLQPVGNNVLIGTTTDNGYRVNLNGSISFAFGFLSNFRGSGVGSDVLVGNDGSRFYIGGNTYVAGTFTTTSNISVTGSVTATGGFFDTSDSKLKILVKDYEQPKGIENVAARMYVKNSRKELGYFAQDLQEILPSAVIKGEDGFLTLSYTQVHTAKIAYLEDKIAQLEELIKTLL